MLIDTILRQLPIPKVYMRTRIDLDTQASYREVVDGQQRLRAIIDFADDKLSLGKRAKEFAGAKYSTLAQELQERFLAYQIGTEQLINASDDDVLEIFSRLNSYTLPLDAAELRHAEFQGEFKWAVHEASSRWTTLWENFQIVAPRQRLRMADDALMAEMFGVLLEGIKDGGYLNIKRLYRRYDIDIPDFPQRDNTDARLDRVLDTITSGLGDVLREKGPLSRAPHFLMLFAGVAHATGGIPLGDLTPEELPDRHPDVLSDLQVALLNLEWLSKLIERDENIPRGWEQFWKASQSSTQRIASRRIRFPIFYRALLPTQLGSEE